MNILSRLGAPSDPFLLDGLGSLALSLGPYGRDLVAFLELDLKTSAASIRK